MPIENLVRVIISSVFTIGFGLSGVYLTVQYLKARTLARQSMTWPAIRGEVTTSWVRKGSLQGRGMRAIVKYTYTVMGQTYESDKLSTADLSGMKLTGPESGAKQVTKQYPKGRQVNVYYDPQNPAQAVLERDLNGQNGQGLLLATLITDMVAVVSIGLLLSSLSGLP
jgi:hypothetical protein